MLIGKDFKNRYRIYDRLGMGGAATVFLARDSQSGQMVIVKVVHSHLIDDHFIARFKREIDLLQQLDTPHVIKLYDWGLQEEDEASAEIVSYIVAEFVEGHTLADVIDTRAPLSEAEALNIAQQILLGLQAVHEKGVVHRDVKSQNIMITPAKQIKLIDFGIAKGPDHSTVTKASHFAGTLYYAPPEQILQSSTVDHRADIYAVGIVLYEMLTGELPIKDREIGAVAAKIIAGTLDPIPDLSDELSDIMHMLLATKPEERYQQAAEAIQDINNLLGRGRSEAIPLVPEVSRDGDQEAGRMFPPQIDLDPSLEETAIEVPEDAQQACLITSDGTTLLLLQGETVMGRSHPRHEVDPDIDLWGMQLEGSRTVSRRHCRIYFAEGGYYLEDLGSMNGTFLNGERIEPVTPILLAFGDEVAAGRVVLRFEQQS